jgi:hypothetical protein
MQASLYTRERKHIGSVWSMATCLALLLAAAQSPEHDAMVASGGGDEPRAMECETTLRFLLHDLEEQGVSFYSLSAKQMIHVGLATVT